MDTAEGVKQEPGTTGPAEDGEVNGDANQVNEVLIGAPHAGEGRWASCIRVIDPVKLETLHLLELEDNEAAFSVAITQFANDPEHYLIVGTAKDYTLAPRAFSCGFVHVYKIVNHGHGGLQFLHKVTA